jgi:hypothetical protein
LGRVPHETQQQRVEAWVDHVRTPRESATLRTRTLIFRHAARCWVSQALDPAKKLYDLQANYRGARIRGHDGLEPRYHSFLVSIGRLNSAWCQLA